MDLNDNLFIKAKDFFTLYYREINHEELLNNRLQIVEEEINNTGTYLHTNKELVFGAKVAWRNSNRCIGRLYWKSLNVVDMRHLDDEKSIENAIFNHLETSTNNGAIKPTITVFRQKMPNEEYGIRIHNSQLINYAGYLENDGTIIGDPKNIEFTTFVESRKWKNKRANFEVLPILLQLPNQSIYQFDIPKNLILEVDIEHPSLKWMAKLGLKWYALPAISNMSLEIGGIEYTAAPFSGWYMITEIGARNLSDVNRLNQLPIIARKMGLDTARIDNLWKDKALVELTQAVLYSFNKKGVRVGNHHVVSEHFITFQKQEVEEGREVTADWEWIVPPISASSTQVFHIPMNNKIKSPNFFENSCGWKDTVIEAKEKKCPFQG
jgi:nitric-oxide synthase